LAQEWKRFISKEQLSQVQAEQFARYMELLRYENKHTNLTAITEPEDIIALHFRDSLRLKDFMDLAKIKVLCDVGTGAGFPGIPLKIVFPHLKIILIEVNNKKISFLRRVIQELALDNCEVCPLDWRTFLRQTDHAIDIFCARASLLPQELVRMFKPSSPYQAAVLVYWASAQWAADKKVAPFVKDEHVYHINNKRRRLIMLSRK